MIMRRYGGLSLIALACAAGSYLATYAVQQEERGGPTSSPATATAQSVSRWLELSPPQVDAVREIEATFAADRQPLEAKLDTERERLATLLENPATTDAEILQQVENVIAAHDALERRVAAHLVAMRPHLTAEQQKRLFNRFASSVRESGGGRWRHGQPGGAGDGRRGGGPPPGRGPGSGRGRGGEGRGRHGEQTTTAPAP
ncbi:MAG: periplasmic heavy metal sensor [Phycisphaerae bacterium]|jgi:Spy/CpxP family protein refolding chaperone